MVAIRHVQHSTGHMRKRAVAVLIDTIIDIPVGVVCADSVQAAVEREMQKHVLTQDTRVPRRTFIPAPERERERERERVWID